MICLDRAIELEDKLIIALQSAKIMATIDQRIKARKLKIRVRLFESPIMARHVRTERRKFDLLSNIVDELLDDGRNGLHKEDE